MPTALTAKTTALWRFIRPRDWWYYLGLPLLAGDSPSTSLVTTLAGVLAAAACMAFAFGWNSWNDEGVDTFRPWSPRQLAVVLLACVVLALVTTHLVGPLALLAAVVSLAAGWSYSGGPRLKRVPFVNTLANAPIFVPLGLLGGDLGPHAAARWGLLAAFGFLLLQNQLIHEIQHADEDREAHVGTTHLALGVGATGVLSALLGLAAAATVAWLPFAQLPRWCLGAVAAPMAALSLAQLATRSRMSPQSAGRLRAIQRWLGLTTGIVAWGLLTLAG